MYRPQAVFRCLRAIHFARGQRKNFWTVNVTENVTGGMYNIENWKRRGYVRSQQYDLFRTTVVCVDGYENKVPVGRWYNSQYETGATFHGVMELMLSLESMLEEAKFPQSFSNRRTFGPPGECATETAGEDAVKEGKLATFALRILFRQNASWQGSVFWYEGKQEESFRSLLELLVLIDSALTTAK